MQDDSTVHPLSSIAAAAFGSQAAVAMSAASGLASSSRREAGLTDAELDEYLAEDEPGPARKIESSANTALTATKVPEVEAELSPVTSSAAHVANVPLLAAQQATVQPRTEQQHSSLNRQASCSSSHSVRQASRQISRGSSSSSNSRNASRRVSSSSNRNAVPVTDKQALRMAPGDTVICLSDDAGQQGSFEIEGESSSIKDMVIKPMTVHHEPVLAKSTTASAAAAAASAAATDTAVHKLQSSTSSRSHMRQNASAEHSDAVIPHEAVLPAAGVRAPEAAPVPDWRPSSAADTHIYGVQQHFAMSNQGLGAPAHFLLTPQLQLHQLLLQ